MEALVYLAASEGLVGASAIGRDLAYDHEPRVAAHWAPRGRIILEPLVMFGLVEAFGRYRYALTERGRIAAALILFQRPGMLAAFFDEDIEREGAQT